MFKPLLMLEKVLLTSPPDRLLRSGVGAAPPPVKPPSVLPNPESSGQMAGVAPADAEGLLTVALPQLLNCVSSFNANPSLPPALLRAPSAEAVLLLPARLAS